MGRAVQKSNQPQPSLRSTSSQQLSRPCSVQRRRMRHAITELPSASQDPGGPLPRSLDSKSTPQTHSKYSQLVSSRRPAGEWSRKSRNRCKRRRAVSCKVLISSVQVRRSKKPWTRDAHPGAAGRPTSGRAPSAAWRSSWQRRRRRPYSRAMRLSSGRPRRSRASREFLCGRRHAARSSRSSQGRRTAQPPQCASAQRLPCSILRVASRSPRALSSAGPAGADRARRVMRTWRDTGQW
mmetsp:Transcript_98341/g.317050  ORF Transcript_98341/g.317050 Transcript_98341/m.317050 type:complete len:238 (+) Transcript_98341:1292-2005(+)